MTRTNFMLLFLDSILYKQRYSCYLTIKIIFHELKYLASEAYVDSSLSLNKTHLELTVTGFNDSLEPFMNDYFKTLIKFDISQYEELFKNKYAFLQ